MKYKFIIWLCLVDIGTPIVEGAEYVHLMHPTNKLNIDLKEPIDDWTV